MHDPAWGSAAPLLRGLAVGAAPQTAALARARAQGQVSQGAQASAGLPGSSCGGRGEAVRSRYRGGYHHRLFFRCDRRGSHDVTPRPPSHWRRVMVGERSGSCQLGSLSGAADGDGCGQQLLPCRVLPDPGAGATPHRPYRSAGRVCGDDGAHRRYLHGGVHCAPRRRRLLCRRSV